MKPVRENDKWKRRRVWVIGCMLGTGVVGVLAVAVFSYALSSIFGPPFDEAKYDWNVEILTDRAAWGKISEWTNVGNGHQRERYVELPSSAKNFWYWEGGGWGGSINYGTFECGSREDCLKSVESLSMLQPDQFTPWKASRYAVVMDGLDFYWHGKASKKLKSYPWQVRKIENGLVYERVTGRGAVETNPHERMVYYAIDLDRNRVYFHYESGGFPPDVYVPGATYE